MAIIYLGISPLVGSVKSRMNDQTLTCTDSDLKCQKRNKRIMPEISLKIKGEKERNINELIHHGQKAQTGHHSLMQMKENLH